jgi:hypothetical protein
LLSLVREKEQARSVISRGFEAATTEAMGSTFHTIIYFHLKRKFGKDPYEVLIEDPKCFYNGLKEVLGAGAEAVINLVGTFLTIKYDVDCTAEEFTGLFTKDSTLSTQKLSKIFGSIIIQEEQKLKP